MTETPEIPGVINLKELGRISYLVAYRGEMDGTEIAVEYLTDETDEGLNNFYRTTALQSRLGHPGMLPVLFSGMHDQKPYRVKKLVEGTSVSGLFARGPLSTKRLVSAARALASTLDAIHQRGMTHTEIHPHCLQVDSSGSIRFTDAGRAWPIGRSLPETERSRALPYLAPEVVAGAPARAESDVFALGAVLAALAHGQPAPAGGVTNNFVKKGSASLSPALRVLLRSMLDKDPSNRPEAQTVADALARIDQLDVLLKLRSWKPASSANTFLGHHPYPVIGREKELGELMALWHQASKGNGLSVTLLGPKGCGRHRLVEELRRGVVRSGGNVVRHRLQAESQRPTLIVNYSHKGREGHNPDQPWLSVNFAASGPVPDQHTIELGPLPEGDCLRLTEAYLASPLEPKLQEAIFSPGPQLPQDAIAQLDRWCEEGVLRPNQGRWLFDPEQTLPVSTDHSKKARSANVSKLKIDYDQALQTIVGLWATSLEQDDPLISALVSICKALKCERADLYQIINEQPKYVCASSFGRHRMNKELMEQVLTKFEPVWSGNNLLFPLRCGLTFCGFISLEWWEAGAPRFGSKLFQMLAMASTPIALTLGQTQLEDRRLQRISMALEELLESTQEPSDIMSRLADGLRKSLEFDILSAWLVRDGKLDRLFTNPKGEPNDGSGFEEKLFCEPYKPRKQVFGEDAFLALPLTRGKDLLGGVIISRDPSIDFTETETSWAAALTRVGQSALTQAAEFGGQVSATT
jgi:serine/threonine protein kinase